MLRPLFPITIVTLSSFAGAIQAQRLDVRAPLAGFVHHGGARSVRPVFGTRGAALLGPAVFTAVESASIAPDGKWAVVASDGRSQLLRDLSEPVPTEVSGPGLLNSVDHVAWSRSGSFAVLYSSGSRLLQRVRLSATDVFPEPPISISWGDVTSLAIDAAGRQVAIGIADGSLYLWTAGQPSPDLLPTITQAGAVAFDETGGLFAVDAASQRILKFDPASGAVEFASLSDDAAADAVGLAVSKGGRYLLLADRSNRAISVYEISSGALTRTIPLDFAPTRFDPLSSDPSFVLNDPGANEWLLILDAGETPGVSFVPALQEEGQ